MMVEKTELKTAAFTERGSSIQHRLGRRLAFLRLRRAPVSA